MRARLAAARALSEKTPPVAIGSAPMPAVRLPAAIPPAAAQVLLGLLASPEGTTASAAGTAIGKSKTVAYEYLTALKDQGIAELTGSGPNSRYRLTARSVHEPEQAGTSPTYLTIQALAEAVHAGLADADEATREVLEKVWEIEHRPGPATSHGGVALARGCRGRWRMVTMRSFEGSFARSFGSRSVPWSVSPGERFRTTACASPPGVTRRDGRPGS